MHLLIETEWHTTWEGTQQVFVDLRQVPEDLRIVAGGRQHY